MAAGKYNITAEQGSTFYFNGTISTDGTPWDLTGYSGRMQVRTSVGASTALLSLTTAAGDITLNSSGEFSVSVDADTMADILAGRHVYDFEVESAGGEVSRILEGKFTVKAEVTR